jgi:hypothetical protein
MSCDDRRHCEDVNSDAPGQASTGDCELILYVVIGGHWQAEHARPLPELDIPVFKGGNAS